MIGGHYLDLLPMHKIEICTLIMLDEEENILYIRIGYESSDRHPTASVEVHPVAMGCGGGPAKLTGNHESVRLVES